MGSQAANGSLFDLADKMTSSHKFIWPKLEATCQPKSEN